MQPTESEKLEMSELTDLLGVFFERRLGVPEQRPTLEDLRAEEICELLWPLGDLFREKMPLIKMIGSREEFDRFGRVHFAR